MKEEMTKLIDLQAIDTEIAGFDQAIELKQQIVVSRQQSIAEKEESIIQCRNKIEELNQSHRDTKAEHDDAGIRIKDRQNKMMQVQTSREHQALLKEIEENKKLFKESEERLLQYLEQIEQAEKEAVEFENLCTGEKTLLGDETDSVNKQIKKIETTRKNVASKRAKLTAALKAPLMKRYNILLKKRAGLAVVGAVGGVCQGCYMTIPPQLFNEVRKGEKMNLCPTCQRIMYYKELETEAVGK